MGPFGPVFGALCWLFARFRLLLLLVVCFGFLLLSWSLSSKLDLAFACFCLLGRAFARSSVELILNLNSSWLYALLWLTLACFGLLWLALAPLAACAGRILAGVRGLLWLALACCGLL